MSDTKDVIGRLQRFWTERHVHITCPVCANDEFNVDEGAEIYIPEAVDARSGKRVIGPDLMKSYAVYCINCGFVLNFMKTVFDGLPATSIDGNTND